MMKRVKLIGLVLVAVHVLSYLFLSELMLERKACDKFLQFTERRFQNPYNKNVRETILVSSCGDEFFRDPTRLITVAGHSNPKYPPEEINNWETIEDPNSFTQYVRVVAFPQDIMAALRDHTDTTGTRNCIVYEICTTRSIPLSYRKVDYTYIYGHRPANFHDIMYTNMNGAATSHYVWLIFVWVELTGTIYTMLDHM
jgi:hypothetical protein